MNTLKPKPNVNAWNVHHFIFPVEFTPDNSEKKQILHIYTNTIAIQNLGRKSAKNLEIYHTLRPMQFNIIPNIDYTEDITLGGEHFIRFSNIAPKQLIMVEFLSFNYALPRVTNVKTDEGEVSVTLKLENYYLVG